MEKITFSIVIHAPREKVWNTMLTKDTYEKWTAAFHEGSTFVGSWEKGSEIEFLGPDEQGNLSGGMYARVVENRPHEFVSVQHLGEMKDGQKVPWPITPGMEGFENYSFADVDGGTEVSIELTIPKEWKDMFVEAWPKALEKLKMITEN